MGGNKHIPTNASPGKPWDQSVISRGAIPQKGSAWEPPSRAQTPWWGKTPQQSLEWLEGRVFLLLVV